MDGEIRSRKSHLLTSKRKEIVVFIAWFERKSRLEAAILGDLAFVVAEFAVGEQDVRNSTATLAFFIIVLVRRLFSLNVIWENNEGVPDEWSLELGRNLLGGGGFENCLPSLMFAKRVLAVDLNHVGICVVVLEADRAFHSTAFLSSLVTTSLNFVSTMPALNSVP